MGLAANGLGYNQVPVAAALHIADLVVTMMVVYPHLIFSSAVPLDPLGGLVYFRMTCRAFPWIRLSICSSCGTMDCTSSGNQRKLASRWSRLLAVC